MPVEGPSPENKKSATEVMLSEPETKAPTLVVVNEEAADLEASKDTPMKKEVKTPELEQEVRTPVKD